MFAWVLRQQECLSNQKNKAYELSILWLQDQQPLQHAKNIGVWHPAAFANKSSWESARQQHRQHRWVTHVSEQQFQSGDDMVLETRNAHVRSTAPA